VRRQAKASSAESNASQGARLGSSIRKAVPCRRALHSSRGRGGLAARRVVPSFSVLAAVLALAVIAVPAEAGKTHLPRETFGSASQPSFGHAQAIAVDQSNGDVLIMDSEENTISRYNSDGTPDNFSALGGNVINGQGVGDETPQGGLFFSGRLESQVAVDSSGGVTDGDIYVTQGFPNVINIFSETGEYLGQLSASSEGPFSEACGVAVDSSGGVYVGDYGGGIHKFVPVANPPLDSDNTANFSSVTTPCALAAGAGPSAGFLFAAQYNGPISKIDSSTGELKYVLSPDASMTLSVDPGTGNVFGANASLITEIDASGAASASGGSSFITASEVQGIAVNGGNGNVYVSRAGLADIEVFGPSVVIPTVQTGAASSVDKASATLNGTITPDGLPLEECKFEYGTTAPGYGQTIPCAESLGAIGFGTSPVPVHADITGLSAGETYHYRLVAKNENGSVSGSDETLLTAGPVIADTWIASVNRTEATLKAKVNPEGEPTTYRIEWGPDSSYGSGSAEVGVGSDTAVHTVSRTLTDLQPGSTYHWHLVATNPSGVAESADKKFVTYAPRALESQCPNQIFRVGPAADLPDCRAYEMVSPVDKNGGEIAQAFNGNPPGAGFFQAAPSGEKITYSSPTSFGDQVSAQNVNQYLATRNASNWSSHGINPPITARTVPFFLSPYALHRQFWGFSEDLSSAWLLNDNDVPITQDGIEGFVNLYRRDNLNNSFEAVTVATPLKYAEEGYEEEERKLGLEFKGASADGSQSIYQAAAAMTPDAAAAFNQNFQVYDFSAGELHLVSILPDGTPNLSSSYVGWRFTEYGYRDVLDRAVSKDGTKIFWMADSFGQGDGGHIFVRKNPTQPQSALSGGKCTEPDKGCTVAVSESVSAEKSEFWTASTDGSKAIFRIHSGPLLNDLYEFDVETETPTLIAGQVSGVVGASEDLSYVYFLSGEVLTAGASAGGQNLYVEHDGSFHFIATLTEKDAGEVGAGIAVASPILRDSRVTPDGRHLAFMSTEQLTGYDNTDANSVSPAPSDLEVFIYDADADKLSCASCNPSGARPLGQPLVAPFSVSDEKTTGLQAAAWIPTWENEFHPSRVLSDDGDRLFFNSFDALVPGDTNGAQDVYQWEAEGAGDCREAEGCISLISTGESAQKSEFIDASSNGDDVFIRTKSSIDPADPGLYDLYDVRVGGGYPVAIVPPACVGDACQGPPSAPDDPTPASASFKGAGNSSAPKASRRCAQRQRRSRAKPNKRHAEREQAKHCKRGKRRPGR
jgi:hypothetical protein